MKVTRLPITTLAGESASLLPVYASRVSAGFPSPADDYIEAGLDLNEYLVKKPSATFIARAQGDSMLQYGIFNADLLIVDRSIEPEQDHVVIAALDGELVCKLLDKRHRLLRSGNAKYPPIAVTEDIDLVIEGVVTHSIRTHARTG